jgi:hypothetical protein
VFAPKPHVRWNLLRIQETSEVEAMEYVAAQTPICSAKGCRAAAEWVLAWNNPKIHAEERRKTWLACEEHREHLSKFLGVRGFLKDVVPLQDWDFTEPR